MAGKPSFFACLAIAFGSIAPSSMLKQEKTRKGTNGRADMAPDYAEGTALGKGRTSNLSPINWRAVAPARLMAWPPGAAHDVADLPHPPAIGFRDAGIGRAAVAVAQEGIASRSQNAALAGIGGGQRPEILRRHLPVQRGQAAVAADRDFAACPRIAAIEAGTRRGHGR